jgi:hypothetical protein
MAIARSCSFLNKVALDIVTASMILLLDDNLPIDLNINELKHDTNHESN